MNLLRMCIGLAVAFSCFGDQAQAQSVFEKKIFASNPCSQLTLDKGLLEISIDHMDYVRIDALSLVLQGDMIEAGLKGALSCKTSDAALLTGSVGADIAVSAGMSVADCQAVTASVTLSNINGDFAPVLEAFKSEAEAAILAGVRGQLQKSCQGLVASLAP